MSLLSGCRNVHLLTLSVPGRVVAQELMDYHVDVDSFTAGVSQLPMLLDAGTFPEPKIHQVGWIKLMEYEHHAFWDLASQGIRDFDPAWLADYSAMLARTLHSQGEHQSLAMQAEYLFQMSKMFLNVSNAQSYFI